MVNLFNSYMYFLKSHLEPWWNCQGLDWRSSGSSIHYRHTCISSRHESSTMVNLLGSWQTFSINSYMYFFLSLLEPWRNCQGFERHSSSIHTCIFSRVVLNHGETVKSWHIFINSYTCISSEVVLTIVKFPMSWKTFFVTRYRNVLKRWSLWWSGIIARLFRRGMVRVLSLQGIQISWKR